MKKELYAYSTSYVDRFKTSNLSDLLGLIAFNNSIFMFPLFFVELWLGIVITFVYFVLIIITKKEVDRYSKGLLCVFLLVFFLSAPMLIILIYQYHVLWYVLVHILLSISGYELIFIINLKQKRYSNNKRGFKKCYTLTFSAIYATTMLGRLFGTFMENIEWVWVFIVPLLTILLTFSVSYAQRYVIYKFYLSKKHHEVY